MGRGAVAGATLSLLVALAVPTVASVASVAPAGAGSATTVLQSFSFTGTRQSFTVPDGVCSVTVDLHGANEE